MKVRTTIILFLVLAGLVAFYIFVVQKGPGTKGLKEREKRLFAFDAEKATKLEIARGPSRVVLEKQGQDDWRLTSPLAARAASGDVARLVSDLETLQHTAQLTPKKGDPAGLAAYGLEPPAAVVTLTAGGKTAVLRLGHKAPVRGDVYAAVGGDPEHVYTVAESISSSVNKPTNDWRDRALAKFTREDVKELDIDRADSPPVVLVRQGADWRLTKPLQDGAEESAVGALLDKLDGLRVDTFVNDAPADLKAYGLEPPALKVAFTASAQARGAGASADKKDTRTGAVLLGHVDPNDKNKVYAKVAGEPFVYAVPATALKDLSPSTFALRRKQFADYAANRVRGVTISSRGREIILARAKDGAWTIEKPKTYKTEGASVTAFLDDLKGATAERFIDAPLKPAELGLDDKERTVIALTCRDDENDTKSERVLTFLVGARSKDGKELYLKRGTDDFAIAASTRIDQTLALGDLAFRDRGLMEFDKSLARSLTVVRDGVTCVSTRPDTEDTWSMTAPVKAKADSSGVSNILWDLMGLRAQKLVADKPADLKSYGLDRPAVSVTVTLKDSAPAHAADATKVRAPTTVTKSIQAGAKTTEDTYYARIPDTGLVATIAKSTFDDLTGELHDRTVLTFDRDKVKSITVARAGEAPFTFKKEGDAWKLDSPLATETLALKSDTVDLLVTDLYDLRTKRFMSYDAADPKPFGLDRPRVTVTVTLDAEVRTILIGGALPDGPPERDPQAGLAYARTSQVGIEKAVFELGKDETAHLMRPLGAYLIEPLATMPASRPRAAAPAAAPASGPASRP